MASCSPMVEPQDCTRTAPLAASHAVVGGGDIWIAAARTSSSSACQAILNMAPAHVSSTCLRARVAPPQSDHGYPVFLVTFVSLPQIAWRSCDPFDPSLCAVAAVYRVYPAPCYQHRHLSCAQQTHSSPPAAAIKARRGQSAHFPPARLGNTRNCHDSTLEAQF